MAPTVAPLGRIAAQPNLGGRVTSLRRNVMANLFGRAWASVIVIILTPAYLRVLGVEAYGLIGAFVAFQTVAMLFDFGLGLTLNRQLATLSVSAQKNTQEIHDTVRTFESIYWLIGALIGVTIAAAAPIVAQGWFHASAALAAESVTAVALMGVAIGAQFPSALYLGGLLGFHRQATANALLALAATLRGVGALFVILTVGPNIAAFFAWQVIASCFQTALFRWGLIRALPVAREIRFRQTILAANLRFAAGLTAITALGTVITQVDKVMLTLLVSLENFGYYALSWTVASGLYLFVTPIFNAVFPSLARSTSSTTLGDTYHRACQVGSLLLLPPAVTVVIFAPEALSAWLGNPTQVQATIWLVRILAAGTAINGLLNLPYALMLATGWTRLLLATNVIALIALIPLILFLVASFGMGGAATAWFAYNLSIALAVIPLMHRRLLVGQAMRWYTRDVGPPLIGALCGAGIVRLVAGEPSSRASTLLLVAAAWAASAVGAWIATPSRSALIGLTRGDADTSAGLPADR